MSAIAISPVGLELMLAGNPPKTLRATTFELLAKWSSSDDPSLDPEPLRCWVLLLDLAMSGPTGISIWESLVELFLLGLPTGGPSKYARSGSSGSAFGRRSYLQILANGHLNPPCLETEIEDMDKKIRGELDGLIYPNTPSFFDTFFKGPERVLQRARRARFPHPTWVSSNYQYDVVVDWFISCTNAILLGESRCQYVQSPIQPQGDSTAKCTPDVFLRLRSDEVVDPAAFDWSQVLVVGALKKFGTNTLAPELVVELASHVHLVFTCQYYRRFVHAFTLCGDLLRCWIFHRGGGFTSEEFSIKSNPQLFVSIFISYAYMSRRELGFDPSIAFEDGGSLQFSQKVGCTLQRFELKPSPFFTASSFANGGTTCWEARIYGETEYKYVCKDVWRPHTDSPDSSGSSGSLDSPEAVILDRARGYGTEGLAEYVSHEDVYLVGALDDIAGNIMKGLQVHEPLNLRSPDDQTMGNPDPSPPRAPHASPQSVKRNRSPSPKPSQRTSLRLKKRSDPTSPHNAPPSSKKRRNTRSAAARDTSKQDAGGTSTQGTASTSKQGATDTSKQEASAVPKIKFNRIHSRLITIKGRPIYQFTSNLELLLAFRDAMRGHRSLVRLNLIHRDVSINNIMITGPWPREDGFKGFLTDLDLALSPSDAATDSTAYHRPIEFRAIGVLSGDPHTYRHDLESFFYVFLWICIHYHHGGVLVTPPPKIFSSWGGPSYDNAIRFKRGHMSPRGFEVVLSQFTEQVGELKTLALGMRDALFPYKRITETDVDPEELYHELLNHIGTAIQVIQDKNYLIC